MCALHRRRSFGMESLERRTLMAADLLNGTLTIVGTTGNDNIQVQVAVGGPNAGQLQVDVNGQQTFFDPLQVTSINISGLSGNDHITVDDAITVNTLIDGGAGNDDIKGGGGNDTIHGRTGNDTIDGSLGNDTVYGDQGNDSIHAGDGDDTVHGNQGNDSIWGGDGDDTIDGDQGNDTIDGEVGDDVCHGNNGNDNLHGGFGNDQVFGDNGKDSLWGDDNNDFLDGGNGTDDCHGGLGDDDLKGGNGTDNLDGDQGNNLLDGDHGHDNFSNGDVANLDNEFRSIFTGGGGESGSAKFDVKDHGGSVENRFEVHIQNFSANATLDVTIDNVVVGQINTDNNGSGDVKFSTDPSGNDLPFPVNFPTMHDGSIILVGTVQGTFVPWHSVT